jgi:phosphoglycolate phosphatase-like HAD superfamily hydrolase
MNPQDELKNLQPKKKFFIGIDSDGCVFDTMEIKQKECFCPNFIRLFGFQAASKYARETWEFVNLYSKNRGVNRFPALYEAVQLLAKRPEVLARGVKIPDLKSLKEWIDKETKLGNPALEKYAAGTNDPIINLTLKWSKKVNADIAEMVYGISPFPYVRESLEKLASKADAMVVSQTPLEALKREWEENKMEHYLRIIAGQEHGTKSEHLALAAKGKYADDQILMIGDAFGDMKAARNNGVLFFPINPGHEEESWEEFFKTGLDHFFKGTFAGSYEEGLVERFKKYLPDTPSWKTIP